MPKFRIVSSESGVRVIRVPSGKRRTLLKNFVAAVLGLYWLLLLTTVIRSAARSHTSPFPTSVAILQLLSAPIFVWFALRRSQHADAAFAEALSANQQEVAAVQEMSLTRQSQSLEVFARASIHKVRFGAVQVGRYAATMGLLFEAAGKTRKALPGLEAPEAKLLLDELARLGYDLQRDPGMTMLVEMEATRRNGKLRRWLDS